MARDLEEAMLLGDVAEQEQNGLQGSGAQSGPLARRAYLHLKKSIMSLQFAPGDALHKNKIASELGISRSPVSEALTKLATEGLVEIIPQSGTYVAGFSIAEIRECAFLREALELAAVAKVAVEHNQKQVTLLNRSLRLQQLLIEDGDVQGFYRADEDMHALIMSFTGYRRLLTIAKSAWLQVNRVRQLVLPSPGRIQETLAEHRTIVGAISKSDPEAARTAMKEHLGQLLTRLNLLKPGLIKST